MNSNLITKYCKKAIILISFLILNFGYSTAVADSKKGPLEILFIGSSYFNFNDLPNLVKNLAEHSGKEVYIDKYIPSGLYLQGRKFILISIFPVVFILQIMQAVA